MAKTKEEFSYNVTARYKKKGALLVINSKKEHVNVVGDAVTITPKGDKKGAKKPYTYRAGTEEDRKEHWERNLVKNKAGEVALDANGEPISNQTAIIRVKNVTTDTASNT